MSIEMQSGTERTISCGGCVCSSLSRLPSEVEAWQGWRGRRPCVVERAVAMSLLASGMQAKVAACQGALKAVSEHLDFLCCKSPADVHRKLAPMEDAELQVAMAYAVASLYFSHLLTQGVDPSDHPIKQELDRIQKYFKKLRETKETLALREGIKKRARVDTEAAKRIVQHYALAAEARAQRGGAASSVGMLAPPHQADADEHDAAEDGEEEADPEIAGDVAELEAEVAQPAAAETVDTIADDPAAEEEVEPPTKRRKKRVESGAPGRRRR